MVRGRLCLRMQAARLSSRRHGEFENRDGKKLAWSYGTDLRA